LLKRHCEYFVSAELHTDLTEWSVEKNTFLILRGKLNIIHELYQSKAEEIKVSKKSRSSSVEFCYVLWAKD